MMGMPVRCLAVLALALLAQGCGDFPKDSRDTLKHVAAGAPLKVGYTPAEPWVSDAQGAASPGGIEADLIREWAAANGARIHWIKGSENQLVEALAQNRVDVAIGGFLHKTPHGPKIGMTQPYLTTRILIGAAPGAALREEWEGVPVRYDARRPEFAAAIVKADAVAIAERTGHVAPYAALYEQELEALGFQPTNNLLLTQKRVIGTAPAENALLLSLDRFLHARKGAIEARLGAEARQ